MLGMLNDKGVIIYSLGITTSFGLQVPSDGGLPTSKTTVDFSIFF
jgi:hypothetical protein